MSRHYKKFIPVNPCLIYYLNIAEILAKSDSVVLITGYNNKINENFAKYIHFLSNRKYMSFLKINCKAIGNNYQFNILLDDLCTDKKQEYAINSTQGLTIYLEEIDNSVKVFSIQAR